MPIYEYLCPDCDLKFELLRQQSKADESATCPRCHNDAKRVFSACASFSRDSEGLSTPVGGASSCGSCSATSCSTCQT